MILIGQICHAESNFLPVQDLVKVKQGTENPLSCYDQALTGIQSRIKNIIFKYICFKYFQSNRKTVNNMIVHSNQ